MAVIASSTLLLRTVVAAALYFGSCTAQAVVARICLEPHDIGSCRAFIPSYYFNSETKICDCFVYGGCSPGGNNFNTLQQCMAVCSVNPTTQYTTSECTRIFALRDPPITSQGETPDQQQQEQGQDQQQPEDVQPPGHRLNKTSVDQLETIFNKFTTTTLSPDHENPKQQPQPQFQQQPQFQPQQPQFQPQPQFPQPPQFQKQPQFQQQPQLQPQQPQFQPQPQFQQQQPQFQQRPSFDQQSPSASQAGADVPFSQNIPDRAPSGGVSSFAGFSGSFVASLSPATSAGARLAQMKMLLQQKRMESQLQEIVQRQQELQQLQQQEQLQQLNQQIANRRVQSTAFG